MKCVTRLFAASAMSTSSGELRCGGSAPSSAAVPGSLRPIRSPLRHATIDASGTIGCFTYQREPISPRSSDAVPDEERGPSQRRRGDRPTDGEERDRRARVVIRAVPDVVAVHGVALAVVVLMRAEEHVLARERGIAARHLRDDVDRRILKAVREDRRDERRVGGERPAERRFLHVEQRHAARGHALIGGAVGIEAVRAARERDGRAIPLVFELVGDERDDRGRILRRHGALHRCGPSCAAPAARSARSGWVGRPSARPARARNGRRASCLSCRRWRARSRRRGRPARRRRRAPCCRE